MRRPSTAAAIIALTAASTLAAPFPTLRPAPHTLDHFVLAASANEGDKAAGKVSGRLRAADAWIGPRAGALVPADPPRSPDGKLQVYVDCSPLGTEQMQALEQTGVTIDGVETARGRVRGRIDPAALDRVAGFSWVHAVRAIDPAVVRAGSVTTEGDT